MSQKVWLTYIFYGSSRDGCTRVFLDVGEIWTSQVNVESILSLLINIADKNIDSTQLTNIEFCRIGHSLVHTYDVVNQKWGFRENG